jgi:hypothetical protein
VGQGLAVDGAEAESSERIDDIGLGIGRKGLDRFDRQALREDGAHPGRGPLHDGSNDSSIALIGSNLHVDVAGQVEPGPGDEIRGVRLIREPQLSQLRQAMFAVHCVA